MRGRDIMKAIMKQEEIKNAELAKKLGISNATIWERLNNKNANDIPVSLMNKMVRAMGYKVIVVPIDCRIPEKAYEVTSKSSTKEKVDLDALLSDE
jgi:transcriptional regulator with XRE-family HTH domain